MEKMNEKNRGKMPLNIKQNVLIYCNILLVFANLFLAIAAFKNITYTREYIEIMREDSILERRPYLSIDPVGTDIYNKIDNKNRIAFLFPLKNSGKSIGDSLLLEVKSASLVDKLDMSELEWENLKKNKISEDNRIIIIRPPFKEALSLFPEQTYSIGPFILENNNLQKDFNESGKHIYMQVSMEYEGLPFKNVKKKYYNDYEIIFSYNKDGDIAQMLIIGVYTHEEK